MRRVWACAFIIACKSESKAPPSPPPRDGTVVVDASTTDAAVIDAAIAAGPPRANLVLDITPTKRITVTPSGPVMLDGKPVELAKLGGRARRVTKPNTFGAQMDAMTGMILVRVDAIGNRPVLVADSKLPAIRLFQVAAAMQPVGPALEVIDASGKPRAFGFRFAELTDPDPIKDPNDPNAPEPSMLIKIDRTGFHIGETLAEDRHLPLTATLDELKAAVVELTGKNVRFGFVELEGANQPTAFALAAIEALAEAKITGVAFIAGEPGMPSIDIEGSNKLVRRAVKMRLAGPLACYDNWVLDHPGRGGRVDLTFRLDGTVAKDPRVTQVGLDEAFAGCILDVYKTVEIVGQTAPASAKIWFEPDGGTKKR